MRKNLAPWRRRWRLSSHKALAFSRFSSFLGCLAVVSLACTLLLLLHFLVPNPLLPAASLKLQFPGTTTSGIALSRMDPLARPDVAVLPNGILTPRLGFGTAGLGVTTERATYWALQAGYRLIDSAQATEWYNEKAVGRAIRSSNIPRDQLFLVSKLHPRHLGYEVTKQQFNTSLQDLGTSYLDLFLLHYPRCFSAICSDVKPAGTWQQSSKALEDYMMSSKYGQSVLDLLKHSTMLQVNNFNKEELQELVALARIKPSVVQSNSDPFNADKEIQEYCQQEGIQYMGYSTLGSQWLMRGYSINPVLNHPLIRSIAVAQACTPAQVVLSWALEKRQVIVPRSSNQFRIVENLEAQHCNLSRLQVTSIDDLDGHVPRLH